MDCTIESIYKNAAYDNFHQALEDGTTFCFVLFCFFNSENEAGLPHFVLEYLILIVMPNQFYFLKYTNMPTNTGKIKVSQLSSM